MKQFSITLQKDAVENLCDLMHTTKRVQLTGEDEYIFNMLKLGDAIPLDSIELKDKPFLIQFIEAKTSTFFDYTIDDSRIIAMVAQVSKSAGFCFLYLAYIQYLCKKNNINKLDMNIFLDWFKDGFFTNEQLEQFWKEQKIERKSFEYSDNLLDYESAYQSIRLC